MFHQKKCLVAQKKLDLDKSEEIINFPISISVDFICVYVQSDHQESTLN